MNNLKYAKKSEQRLSDYIKNNIEQYKWNKDSPIGDPYVVWNQRKLLGTNVFLLNQLSIKVAF